MADLLPLLFFLVALIYSSVGLGGGSSYIALLILTGVDFSVIPVIGLLCNLVVVLVSSLTFKQKGVTDLKFILPFLVSSMPLAFIGGLLPVNKTLFQILTGMTLFLAGLILVLSLQVSKKDYNKFLFKLNFSKKKNQFVAGGIIGLLSGIVGIGGGIFLSPLLHLTRLKSTIEISAAASLFILLNSMAGLVGQSLKISEVFSIVPNFMPLIFYVALGGFLGSFLGAFKFSSIVVRRLTGLVVILIGVRAFWLALATV